MYLIDGYNLLHAMRREWPHMPKDFHVASSRLMDYLEAFCLRDHVPVIAVMDNSRAPWGPPQLVRPHARTDFAPDADAAIRARLEASATPRTITVVSNDREVTSHAKAVGARTMTCEGFIKKLGKLAQGPKERQTGEQHNAGPNASTDKRRSRKASSDKPKPNHKQIAGMADMVSDMLEQVGDEQELADEMAEEIAEHQRSARKGQKHQC